MRDAASVQSLRADRTECTPFPGGRWCLMGQCSRDGCHRLDVGLFAIDVGSGATVERRLCYECRQDVDRTTGGFGSRSVHAVHTNEQEAGP